jgi:hypothetical protein
MEYLLNYIRTKPIVFSYARLYLKLPHTLNCPILVHMAYVESELKELEFF